MAVATKRAAPQQQLHKVSFLTAGDYSKGGGLPDGDYLWSSLDIVMFQPQKKDGTLVGPAKLAVRIQMDPPNGYQPGEEPRQPIHYSMGTNAHLTYQPDPETGKSLVLVPGGPAAPLYESTNWYILFKSLLDCGMPENVGEDVSVLEGIIVHVVSVPEPDERKGFRQSTSEMQPEQKDRKIPVVMEIKSAPWMEEAPPAPVRTAPKPIGRVAPAPAPVAKATPKVNGKPPAPPTTDDGGNRVALLNAVAEFLETSPNGAKRAVLRLACVKLLADNPSKAEILNQYFSDDEALGGVLGEIGYKMEGDSVSLA